MATPAQILNYRGLRSPVCIQSRCCHQHLTLSRLGPWSSSSVGTVGRRYIPRMGAGRSPGFSRSSSWVNWWSWSVSDLLQQMGSQVCAIPFPFAACLVRRVSVSMEKEILCGITRMWSIPCRWYWQADLGEIVFLPGTGLMRGDFLGSVFSSIKWE